MNSVVIVCAQVSAYTELEGPMIVPCPSGFSAIAQAMASQLGDEAIVRNCSVDYIEWKGRDDGHIGVGALVREGVSEGGARTVEMRAKHVIVTVSLGVLQVRLPLLPFFLSGHCFTSTFFFGQHIQAHVYV